MKRTMRSFIIFLLNLLFLGSLFAFAMFEGGFVSWFLFYSFMPVFIYEVAFFLYPIKNWRISRQFSHHVVSAGEVVNVTIRIKRKIPFPLYYAICEEVFPSSLQSVNLQHRTYQYLNTPEHVNIVRKMKRVFSPWFKRNMSETYMLEEIPRGRHHFQQMRIRISDMFGFVHKEYTIPTSDELIAYPAVRSLYMTGRLSALDQGEQPAYAFTLKSTNIATGTREYMPGDKFSWIDWKQTARKNQLITKEFEQEKSTETLVILNAGYSGSSVNALAFEAAVEVAYSLVQAIYKQSSTTEFLTIGNESFYMTLHHNEVNMLHLREHITKLEPAGEASSFAQALKEETLKVGGGMVTMLVTTQLDEAMKDTILQMGVRMKRIVVMFIQGSDQISETEYERVMELEFKGVIVNVITEKELIRDPIEVKVV